MASAKRKNESVETAFAEGADEYSSLVQTMSIGYALHEMIYDSEGVAVDYIFLDVNPAFERITGLRREDIIGRRIRDIMPSLEKRWIESYAVVVAMGESLHVEDYLAGLGKRFESWAFRPSTGRFVVMISDVTARYERESALKQLNERLERALDATGAGSWDWDISADSVIVDKNWAATIGYSPAEINPLNEASWRQMCHPDDRPISDELVRRHLGGESDRYECEIRLRHKDGHWVWVLDHGRVSLRDESGTPLRMIGTHVDISKRKEAEIAEAQEASRLTGLLDSMTEIVFFKDRSGVYLGCNRAAEAFLRASSDAIVGRKDAELFPAPIAERLARQDALVLEGGTTWAFESWHQRTDGAEALFERKVNPLRTRDGRIVGLSVVMRDVTERYDAARIAAARLFILERSPASNCAQIAREVLDQAEELTGSRMGFFSFLEDGKVGFQGWSSRTLRDCGATTVRGGHNMIEHAGLWAECVERRAPVIHNDYASAQGRKGLSAGHPALTRELVVPVLREGRVVGVLGVGNKAEEYGEREVAVLSPLAELLWDLAQGKISDERARESDTGRELALGALHAGVETWYVEEGRKEYDERWAAILGYVIEDLAPYTFDAWRELCHPDDLPRAEALIARLFAGEIADYECELRLKNAKGGWTWVMARGKIVERNSEGRPLRLTGLMIDISGIKAAEDALRGTIAEKEVLLHELFHRTKNTMQLINAMLELKKGEVSAGGPTRAFEDIQNKILAMALVQEKIYQSGNLSTLDLGEYVGELVGLIKDAAPENADEVDIRVRAVSVPVSVDTAIPCGIVVSELVTNSMLHAFAPGTVGRIEVWVDRDENGEISIAEMDDGGGLPMGFDPRRSPRLGLKTVIGIGEEQLRGSVKFGGQGRGFSCRLAFKDIFRPKRL